MKNKPIVVMTVFAAVTAAFALCACGAKVTTDEPENISVALDKTQISMDLYEASAISAVGDYNGITWTTDNDKVATVDGDGRIIAQGEGSCVIAATDADGKTGECAVTVTDSGARPEFSLGFDEIELGSGVEYGLQCSLTYKGTAYTDYTVKYGSNEFTVLEVNGSKMIGRRLGDTAVKATAVWRGRSFDASANVSVKKISFGTGILSVDKYDSKQLSVTVADKNGEITNAELIWTSSDNDVATVVGGKVYGKTAGTAKITAKLSDYVYAECAVTVNEASGPVLTLEKTEFDLGIDGTDKINASFVFNDEAKSDADITFTSDNAQIATVDSTGNIVMKDYGTAVITVSASWHDITVTKSVTAHCQSLFLDRRSVTLDKYDVCALMPTYRGEGGDAVTEMLTWTSNDEKVVKVKDGVITVVGEGSAEITVTAPDKAVAVCAVDVTYSGVEPVLELSDTELKFHMNGEKTLAAQVKYKGDVVDAVITYTAKNGSGEAVVDDNGKIKMTGYGDATVTVSAAWRGATLSGTVSLFCSSMFLDKTSVELDRYDMCTLVPSYLGQTGEEITETLTWASSNENVVKVVNGKLQTIGDGTATVSVTAADGTSADCSVTVRFTDAEPVLELSDLTLNFDAIGAEQTVSVTVRYNGAAFTDAAVTFVSASDSIAEADDNGKIKVNSDGVTTVTVTAAWRGASLLGTISVDCSGVLRIDKTSVELDRYDECVIAPAYDNRTGGDITETLVWASSNVNVVSVENGRITVVGVGSANVTVTAPGGTVKSCAVTVQDTGAMPRLVLDGGVDDILKKGDSKTVGGHIEYKDGVYGIAELTCSSDSAAISTDGSAFTGSDYGKADVTVSGTWRGASVSATAAVTVYAEYDTRMSDEKLTAAYETCNITQDNQMVFIGADYRSTGALYAVSKHVYDGLYALKKDYIQIAEQNGIIKETDPVYGWYDVDRPKLGFFVGAWYAGNQWDGSTFRLQVMIKEIDGCYFVWMGNMLLFGDPIDGGWNNGSCTQFYFAMPDGNLPPENIINVSFPVGTDDYAGIKKPVADSVGTGLKYEITENIYGTFKYTDETVEENGVTYTKIDGNSIGLFTDWGKAPWYNQDIYNTTNSAGEKYYASFADCAETSVYAGRDNTTGKYYLWFESFDKFVFVSNDMNGNGNDANMAKKRSTLVWTSVDGKKCEHTVRTNID